MHRNWLTISIGVFCVLWAMGQFRRVFIYRYIALRSALTFTVYAFVFFFVPWPKLLIYIFAILTLRAVIDLLLFRANVSIYSFYASDGAFAKARPQMMQQKISSIILYAIGLAVTWYFVGR